MATCDASGDSTLGVPEWTASINSEYSFALGSVEGNGRVLYTHTGERAADIDDVDPYHIFNVYLGVRAEQWSVEIFSTNLFDEEALRAGGGAVNTPLVSIVRLTHIQGATAAWVRADAGYGSRTRCSNARRCAAVVACLQGRAGPTSR